MFGLINKSIPVITTFSWKNSGLTIGNLVNLGSVYFISKPKSVQLWPSQEVRTPRENQEGIFIEGELIYGVGPLSEYKGVIMREYLDARWEIERESDEGDSHIHKGL